MRLGRGRTLKPKFIKQMIAPAYVVLEFKDGMIMAETWYYNGEVFH